MGLRVKVIAIKRSQYRNNFADVDWLRFVSVINFVLFVCDLINRLGVRLAFPAKLRETLAPATLSDTNAARGRASIGLCIFLWTTIIAAKKTKRRTEVRRFDDAFSKNHLRCCCIYSTRATDRAGNNITRG